MTTEPGEFQALMDAIGVAATAAEDLTKSISPESETGEDDAAIAAAAAEGEGEGEGAEGDKPTLTKSIQIGDESIDVVDVDALVKSFTDGIGALRGELATAVGGLLKAVTAQGEMLKSQAAVINELRGSGKGRKSVLQVQEKPAATAEELTKSLTPTTIAPAEFMLKAEHAADAGRISWKEAAAAEIAIGLGQSPDPSIVARVMEIPAA